MSFIDNDDGYVVFEASDDDEEFDSSDDDNEEFLWWVIGQKKSPKAIRNKQADAFELEMNQELSNTMDTLCASNKMLGVGEALRSETSRLNASVKKPEEPKYYDDIYFDSDDDAEDECNSAGQKKKKKRKHPVISNDDLFYDPDMDEADQAWIDRRRQSYRPSENPGKSNASQRRLPTSDAVLNCPACMTTLCLDCQRHTVYKGQYRAMFVLSCKVDQSKTLSYPRAGDKKKKKLKVNKCSANDDRAGTDEEMYHPVQCSVCNTEVAVQDKEEVYHFFNVLASFA